MNFLPIKFLKPHMMWPHFMNSGVRAIFTFSTREKYREMLLSSPWPISQNVKSSIPFKWDEFRISPYLPYMNVPTETTPHATFVGPVTIKVVEPFKTIKLDVKGEPAPVKLDLTFTARTQPYCFKRGTMKAGHEIIWDQSQLIQSGNFSGTYSYDGKTYTVDNWWGQRDHSWGSVITAGAPCGYGWPSSFRTVCSGSGTGSMPTVLLSIQMGVLHRLTAVRSHPHPAFFP